MTGEALGNTKTTQRSIQIVNESGRRVDVFWVNPDTGELIRQTEPFVYNGGTLPLTSYIGHTFEVRELPSSKTGYCGDPSNEASVGTICRMGTFTVNENDQQTIFVRKGLVLDHQDDKTRARDDATKAIQTCHTRAKKLIAAQGDQVTSDFLSEVYQELMVCVESGVAAKMQQVQEEVTFQSNLRKSMGTIIEAYTCADDKLKTTEPISSQEWRFYPPSSGKSPFKVDLYLDMETSVIHYIKDFISTEECEAISTATQDRFQSTATSGDAKDVVEQKSKSQQPSSSLSADTMESGTQDSSSVQGLQASIARIDSTSSEIISNLHNRAVEYAKDATSLSTLAEQQDEDFMAIRFGPGDHWRVHCDGKCNGLPHVSGDRIATMIMFCQTSSPQSALINFRNAGSSIRPEPGSAVFFTYASAADRETDKGYTEYSTCPVVEGEQKIVTQWFRY